MKVRILVADDHPVVRQGLRTLLSGCCEWEVIDEAEDGIEALEMAERLNLDVVVLDVSMPRMSGLDACRRIRKNVPASEILIVTQHDSAQMGARCRRGRRPGIRGEVQRGKRFA